MAKSSLTNEAPDKERGQDSITAASLDDVSKQIVDKTNEEAGAARGAGELEKWNRPRINIYRYLATLYSFVIMGMNDAAYGLETFYDVNYTVISLVFLGGWYFLYCFGMFGESMSQEQKGLTAYI
ncbi:hypothetical protein LCER1_G000378 [Lachnellula cervina]|uniref:Uncharacterized protein n=1 Tax=Lachnellula cervina TaxID=1316786 RepID=A0A7D8YYG9_9HELO|nr:hypothetical protein LCER1_G000378 [Lachnellula cervina]